MPDRTRETLETIIIQHCAPGTTVYHDGWKAYGSINYGQLEMHHEENLIENRRGQMVRTKLNQSYIESLWGDIKHRCKKIYNNIPGSEDHYESFLYEMMWRRLLKKLKGIHRDHFIVSTWKMFHSKTDPMLLL